MEHESDLENIRHDFLSFLDLDFSQINASTKKGLLKGIVNNFFDYLEDLEKEIPCKDCEERIEVKL